MPSHIVDYELPVSNRTQMRIELISCFLNEFSGTGRRNNASRYQYNVETYGNYDCFLLGTL